MSYESIQTEAGIMQSYVARPQGAPKGGVLVIQEIFGVNKELQAKCDGWAEKGYIAYCPDLFWRIKPGIQLTDKTEGEFEQALEYMNQFNIDTGIKDLKATLVTMRNAYPNIKIGTVGYCLGGKLAFLMATRGDADANISYYGVGLDELLSEKDAIEQPALLHIAGEDEYVPRDAQDKIIAAFDGSDLVRTYRYDGADHGFSRIGGAHYHEKAAKLANDRTEAFLAEYLL